MVDREMEKRVWQRVLGKETEPEDLARLLHLSRMQVRDLRTLDGELHRREQTVLGLLLGLYELSMGGPLPSESMGPMGIPRRERLRRCRDRCNEMLELCIRLERHPRYGPVFTDLTRWQRVACTKLEQMR